MGLTPFACITLPDTVRVVYPDGHIESLTRSCSVYELVFGNPDYYICPGTPFNFANRLAADEELEKGVTYFICASPKARPFTVPERQQPRTKHPRRAARILPRFARHHGIQAARSESRTKVIDFHSVAMQHLESYRHNTSHRPPLLATVIIRHCLEALRLPRSSLEQLISEPKAGVSAPTPPAMTESELLPILRSAARCELGSYVSRRQEFYLRRARRRRRGLWKPVLQSISEVSPIIEFLPPVPQQEIVEDANNSKRFSPPRPNRQVPRKNISPPKKRVFAPMANTVTPSPPQPAPVLSPAKSSGASRTPNAKSLYMA